MSKALFMIFIFVTLFAQTNLDRYSPKIYSRLGDEIYESVKNIKKLQQISRANDLEVRMKRYLNGVQDAKKLAYKIESMNKIELAPEYLNRLRELYKEKEYFRKIAKYKLTESIQQDNKYKFISLINNGFIDANSYKSNIIVYYKRYGEEIISSKKVQDIVDQYNKSLRKKTYKKKSVKTKKKERIDRYRRLSKAKKEDFVNKLESELRIEKEKIEQMKIEELGN